MIEIYDYADLGNKHSWDYTMNDITPKKDGIDPICTTDKDIEIGDILSINGKAYCICALSCKGQECRMAFIEAIKNKHFLEFDDENKPKGIYNESVLICPYCGNEEDSFELLDKEDEHECPNCGSVFAYERIVNVTYDSYPVRKTDLIVVL